MPFKASNYEYQGEFSLEDLAHLVGAELKNHGQIKIKNIAPLHTASAGDLSFFDNAKYLEQFTKCKASACIVAPKYAEQAPKEMALIITPEPYRAYAKIAQKFYKEIKESQGIHPTAVIDKTAKIGEGTIIGANTVIGRFVEIGRNCRLASNLTISSAKIGDNCVIHSGVRIGQDGFGFAMGAGGHIKVPQLGGVIIANDVEIGANTCIDRGSGPDTIIGEGTKIDNLVQIGHNVEIGKFCVIIAQVGIAGSTKIADYAIVGGQAGIAGHLKIGVGAKVAANSGVMRDVPAGQTVGGSPAMNIRDWHKSTLAVEKLIRGKND